MNQYTYAKKDAHSTFPEARKAKCIKRYDNKYTLWQHSDEGGKALYYRVMSGRTPHCYTAVCFNNALSEFIYLVGKREYEKNGGCNVLKHACGCQHFGYKYNCVV